MAQQEVKRLVVGENSSCLICGAKDARYAVLDFNIFVCTFCAGIHREQGHKVKGINLSRFTEEEIAMLERGGNKNILSTYFSSWDKNFDPRPTPNNREGVTRFIKRAFVEREWSGNSTLPADTLFQQSGWQVEETIAAAGQTMPQPPMYQQQQQHLAAQIPQTPQKPQAIAQSIPTQQYQATPQQLYVPPGQSYQGLVPQIQAQMGASEYQQAQSALPQYNPLQAQQQISGSIPQYRIPQASQNLGVAGQGQGVQQHVQSPAIMIQHSSGVSIPQYRNPNSVSPTPSSSSSPMGFSPSPIQQGHWQVSQAETPFPSGVPSYSPQQQMAQQGLPGMVSGLVNPLGPPAYNPNLRPVAGTSPVALNGFGGLGAAGGVTFAGTLPVQLPAGAAGMGMLPGGPGGVGLPGLKPGQPSPYPVLMTPNGPAYIMSVSPLNTPLHKLPTTATPQSCDADYLLAVSLNQQLNSGASIPENPNSTYQSDAELARKLQEEENRRAGY